MVSKHKQVKYDVLGIGRAYSDIVASVSSSFLTKYDIPVDAGKFFKAEVLEKIRSELENTQLFSGGPAANTLAGIASLGGRVGYIGKVAQDNAGQQFLEDLEKRGIDVCCSGYVETAAMSATCLVLTTEDGKRSIAFNRGCSDVFSLQDFQDSILAASRCLLVEGHFLTDSPVVDLIIKVVKRAKTFGCKIVFSLTDIPSWVDFSQQASIILEIADIVVGNDREIEALQTVIGERWGENQIIISTLGERGALLRQGQVNIHVPVTKPLTFVSSVGAGDQFLAGFLYGMSTNKDLEQSLDLGAQCAAKIIEAVGAKP